MYPTTQWHRLSQDEKLLYDQDEPSINGDLQPRTHGALYRTLILPILVIALLISMTIHGWMYFNHRGVHLDEACARQTMLNWSPILDDKITYSDTRFNGSLVAGDIYRQSPSPEVDTAWADLGIHIRPSVVGEEEALRAGLTSNQVKRSQAQGGGYFAKAEALHHLHCLNVLRQNLWFQYEYYRDLKMGVWADHEHVVQLHVGHCMDIIRQQLMCTADTGLFGQVWVSSDDDDSMFALSDFNTVHKCKNWDTIRNWAEKNEAAEDDVAEYVEGDLVLQRVP